MEGSCREGQVIDFRRLFSRLTQLVEEIVFVSGRDVETNSDKATEQVSLTNPYRR